MRLLNTVRVYQFIIAIFLSIAFGTSVSSQPRSDIQFYNIQKTEGLSNNTVNGIIKDNLGFVWIATNDGLCRYDGPGQMEIFRADIEKNPDGLSSSNIRSLFLDSEENLWIGTRLGGLTRYHSPTGSWKTFRYNEGDKKSLSNDEVLTIFEDSQHRLWVGTENGLNLFDYKTETFTNFLPERGDPNSLSARAVVSVMEDANGWIWVGSWAGGLHLMMADETGDINKGQFRNFRPAPNQTANNVWSIYQDQQKRYWVGTHGGGLFLMQLPKNATNRQNQQDWRPIFHNYTMEEDNPTSISSSGIQGILQDKRGRLWISTLYGVNCIEEKNLPPPAYNLPTVDRPELQFFSYNFNPNDLTTIVSNNINNIIEDQQGLLWFATASGVSQYNWYTSQFDTYQILDQVHKTPNSQNIYVDPNQNAWLAFGRNGLIKYNMKDRAISYHNKEKPELLLDEYVSAVYSPDDKWLYIGNGSGITMMELKTQERKLYPIPEWLKKGVDNFFIQKIFVDNNQIIWMGSQVGLFSLDPSTGDYTFYKHIYDDQETISDYSITDILQDKSGDLWIATLNGLNRASLKDAGKVEFERFYYDANNPENSLISNQVSALELLDNQLFIGTIAGLCSYDLKNKKFEHYSQATNKYWVQSIEKTDSGDLWASTTEGIFHFDQQEKAFNIFEKLDGLNDLDFRIGASDIDKEGYIYFGSSMGITRLHPDRMVQNTVAPPVHITSIKKMNPQGETTIDGIYQKEIVLDHNDYYLAINFAALNYNRAEKNQYAYKLEGFDETWNYSEFGIPIVYTNLKPQTYTFRVKAANNDGVWSEKDTTLKVIKKPAFWETWWFRIGGLLIGSFLIFGGLKRYTQNIRAKNLTLKNYNENLNKEIEERERFEKALKNREQFLRLIMDNVPQFIYWVDKNYRFLGGNRSYLKFLGIKNEKELIGKKLENFPISADFIAKQKQFLKTVVQSNEPIYNHIGETPDNPIYGIRWLEQDYIPLKNDDGIVIGMLVSGEDISVRVAGEKLIKAHSEKLKEYNKELKRSNKDLEQFAYIASHDLKEPLRTMGNFSGLLAKLYKNKLDEDALEFIDFIQDGVSRMSNLINSLLTYSRVGQKGTKFVDIDLNKLVGVKTFDLSQVIKDRNAEVVVDLLPIIYGEREQIGMVFYNLINNAIKFNENDRPTVLVKAYKEAPEGFWQFSVSDNGIGIEPKYQKQIFEIFHRLHDKQEYEGTGIGLSVCKKIVFRHGGKIWLDSIPGQGTTFYFTISKERKKMEEKGKKNLPALVNYN